MRTQQQYRQEKLEKFEHFSNERAMEANLSTTDKLAKYHNIQNITFKNAAEARKLIKQNAPYLLQMDKPNLLARGCASQSELYSKYLDAFADINDKERRIVSKFILELLDKIKPRNLAYHNYLCYWLNRISFAKAKPWLEAGMPHTLEDTIIMDGDWFINPRANTLVHELTHVHQRLVPFEFEEVYKDLGYLEYSPGVENIKGMGPVVALNRNNPDGLSHNWLWYDKTNRTCWWIGAVFNNITPEKLTDVANVGLKLERDSDGVYYYLKQSPTLLSDFKEFNTFFGDNPNNYHPNEMSAKFGEWMLEYVITTTTTTSTTSTNTSKNIPKNKYNCEGFTIYRKHFEKLINTFYSN
jgi:hypothetical protein